MTTGTMVERVVGLIADYQWWVLGLLGVLWLLYLRRALLARREAARSIFKLEQEQARGRYGRSVAVAAVILLLMAAVLAVTNYLLPSLNRPPEPTPVPTTGPLVAPTLTSTPPPPTITPTATATKPLPTPPRRPTATSGTPAATATPAVRPPACPDPQARITSPGVNQALRGDVPVRGTANIAGFQYYKVEVGPGSAPQDHEWTVVGELHYSPVVNGILETWNSAVYPPGSYTLRLVVVDQTGNYPEPCRVTVTVER